MKETPYTIAEALKNMGYSSSKQPYQDAVLGKTVIVIVANHGILELYQRLIYRKILDDGTPLKEVRSGKIRFESGGLLHIVVPTISLDALRVYPVDNTSYSIYRP